jgi:alkanesulfonate monooxygenase SsuD/methylene tetrahydromethanopterin reductase-like flavin-dependent oxidoreductase (luciferase family)
VTLDHATGGRFELGIGWGSVPTELATFGVGSTEPRERADRLAETLVVVRALWTGEPVDFDGRFHRLVGAQQRPTPLGSIPIVVGGVGPRTLALVAEHADWWNVSVDKLDRVDELRDRVGRARVSVQQMVTYAPDPATRDDVLALAGRRFGAMSGRVAGDAATMVRHLQGLEARGIERAYLWFTDFAEETTLARFGAEVLSQLA